MRPLLLLIPSMFHRRLILLLGAVLVGGVALTFRLAWMTTVDAQAARELAESRLVRRVLIPTTRGRILDRKGRVLAMDRASYDVAIAYPVLSGEWAEVRAKRSARKANKDNWDLMNDEQRASIIEGYERIYNAHVDASMRMIAAYSEIGLGELLETRDEIVRKIERRHQVIVEARVAERIADRERQGYVVTAKDRERYLEIASAKIREQTIPHALVEGVPDEVAFELMRLQARTVPSMKYSDPSADVLHEEIDMLPGLEIIDATRREYPFAEQAVILERSSFPGPLKSDSTIRVVVGDVGSIMLGRVRDSVYREDAQRRSSAMRLDGDLRDRSLMEDGTDRGAYMNNDRVGSSGIESALEHELRGLRGVRTEHLQTRGVSEIDPSPGRDVRLSVDIALTARLRAILDPSVGLTRVQPWHANESLPVGTELDAAIVVLDVSTGEIVSMVSTPTPPRDGDWSHYGVRTDEEQEIFEKVRSPWVNRAVEKPYQPGSIAKALVLCGAAKLGKYDQAERIEATGHLYPDRPNMLRSWIYKDYGITHGDQLGHDPDGTDALMVSSNVFFFTLGQRLGPKGIREVYELFGIGHGYDLGLGATWAGSLGAFDGRGGTEPISDSDAIQMGIGQGPVTWTPLHAADAYATIARGGFHIEPSLLDTSAAPEVRDLGLPSWVTAAALEGLHRVVSDPDFGTGHHVTFEGVREPTFNAPGIKVWGKTGTATSSPLVVDPDGDGPMVPTTVRSGDHSWYVSLVGEEGGAPKYAIAVVVDYGGSGGRVSGPINNQVVHALVAEGYLKGAPSVNDSELVGVP